MQFIILLLIIFFSMLIFYQLFLGHALNNNIFFKGRIIEGILNNLPPQSRKSRVSNNVPVPSPNVSNISLNTATNATVISSTPESRIAADDNTIYNLAVKMINDNNKVISSIMNITLPIFVSDVLTNPIIPFNTNSFSFTDEQLRLLYFIVYSINNNNQQITKAINKPDITIPLFNTNITDSIPSSLLTNPPPYTDNDRKILKDVIKMINDNNDKISIL